MLQFYCYRQYIIKEIFFVMELLSSRKKHPENTVVKINNTVIGNGNVTVIAGPCTIESREQLQTVAESCKKSGAQIIRGGAYKPRTSPYTFCGLREKGLEYLLEVKEITGLPVITEIMDKSDLPLFSEVDILQVGAKNMQNFSLLTALGEQEKPVLLKRGAGSTIEELLYSAEYIMKGGNQNVILCERGIRTFENATRFTFDLNAVALLKEMTHLPVIADPSHSTGIASLVTPVALGAVAAGADGIMVEVHNRPEEALCDGMQSLDLNGFSHLMTGVDHYEKIRSIYSPAL